MRRTATFRYFLAHSKIIENRQRGDRMTTMQLKLVPQKIYRIFGLENYCIVKEKKLT